MYRIWTQVRVTLETLAALHGETPKEMAVQALELAPNGEEWAKRYASWVEAAREELGRATRVSGRGLGALHRVVEFVTGGEN